MYLFDGAAHRGLPLTDFKCLASFLPLDTAAGSTVHSDSQVSKTLQLVAKQTKNNQPYAWHALWATKKVSTYSTYSQWQNKYSETLLSKKQYKNNPWQVLPLQIYWIKLVLINPHIGLSLQIPRWWMRS